MMLFRLTSGSYCASSWLISCLLLWTTTTKLSVDALHMEEAGQLDFLVATSGHGTTRLAHRSKSVLITSDSPFPSDQLVAVVGNAAQQQPPSTSCHVAGRDLATGRLVWRRLVCSKKQTQQQHAVVASGERFYTMDQAGIVRGWTASKGAMIWDTATKTTPTTTTTTTTTTPRLWLQQDLLVAVLGPILSVLDVRTGNNLGSLNVEDVNTATAAAHARWKAPSSPDATLQWIQVVSSAAAVAAADADSKKRVLQLVLGYLDGPNARGSNAAVLEVQVSEVEGFVASTAATPLSSSSTSSFAASLWYTIGSTAGALSSSSPSKDFSWIPLITTSTTTTSSDDKPRVVDLSSIWPTLQWTSLERWQSLQPHSNLARLTGLAPDGVRSMALWESESRQLLTRSDETDDGSTVLALTHCTAFDNLVVGLQKSPPQQSSSPWRAWQVVASSQLTSVPILGDVAATNTNSSLLDGDSVQDLITLACHAKSMSVLLSTTSGTTRVVTFTKIGNAIHSQIRWTAEEGLSSISTAVMLDASHIVLDDDAGDQKHQEPTLMVTSLDLQSRLQVQYKSLKSTILSSPLEILGANQNGRRRYREQTFGFVKIVVLLSKSAHRVWGMGTTDPQRGDLVWTLSLPSKATWHTLVHGKASAAVGVNGINGGTHNREVLVLSNLGDFMEWHCIDGTAGAVHQQGSVSIPSSPVVQIVPILGAAKISSSGTCRQMAVLLHQDHSMTLVPQGGDNVAAGGLSAGALALREIESSTKHGLYAHVVDLQQQQQAKVESYRIHVTDTGSFQASVVGQTLFPGEDVVGLAYPIRDETVQSPTMVLGDDSLLVKYLNPHMAVVVTFANITDKPLLLPNKKTKAKRKPLGVTPPTGKLQQPEEVAAAATTADQDPPNLFVNVIDTVSGRVLHRSSHSNAARPKKSNMPILINENWIIYAFVNDKTRRTEVGVLSLYEGMIDRNGITAFSSPEQSLAFSSLDARESKPVALTKSFALTKQVTALGVTVTRAGISTPQILIACGDDKIYAVDRRMLEPRRPVGELKESEKIEGLQQYRELLPLLSLQALNHNQTVEGVTSIISAATELESQSLILAYGGPDIFFTRTSPSRGFDLLPDSFNRILLSLVVVALLVAMVVLRSMAYKKIVTEGWI